MKSSYLAFDLGASSGRAILGTLERGTMRMEELHRFETRIIEEDDHLYWDQDSLWNDLKIGLDLALEASPDLRSLSVDSWAVDYVPLSSSGLPVRNAFCYRDTRTQDDIEPVFDRVNEQEVYAKTGIQHLPFNTIFQIFDDHNDRPDEVARTDKRLLIADYFNYLFSGEPVIEVSNASTTQLVNPLTRTWDDDLLTSLGFDRAKFPAIVDSGTVYSGTEESQGVKIVCGLSHDTAAAIAAIPADASSPWIYLSSGTWSLLGIELGSPELGAAAYRESYTNELGFGSTVRFLKNMTGMWALEECIRVWESEGEKIEYSDLMAQASEAQPLKGVINLDEPQFGDRGKMEEKIVDASTRAGLGRPESRGELVRLILDSLASNYAQKIETLGSIVDVPADAVLHIVGGGSKNELLNQLTANACNRTVVAGPAESSALGNLLVQAHALGDIPSGLGIRDVVRNSVTVRTFIPQ